MKRENIEEANIIVKRLYSMERAIIVYERDNNAFRLFGRLFRKAKEKAELEIGYDGCSYIRLSEEQQREFAYLIRKWIEEDKRKLETL